MAEPNPDFIALTCTCGAESRVLPTAAGGRTQCSRCGAEIAIPPSPATAPIRAVRRTGRLTLGCLLSLVGSLIGAAVWFLVAWITEHEFMQIAIGIGILAGAGMALGDRRGTILPGTLASFISLSGLLCGRFLIFLLLCNPFLLEDRDDPVGRQQYVIHQLAIEYALQNHSGSGDVTDAAWKAAVRAAEEDVATMTDSEILAAWDAYHAADSGPASEDGATTAQGAPTDWGNVVSEFFATMFGGFDFVYALLAVITAFGIGASGGHPWPKMPKTGSSPRPG